MLSPERVGRVTGSSVGAILGLSPFMTPDDVLRSMVRQYHGAESEFRGNVATDYGHANEENAIFAYEIETGYKVEQVGFLKHKDWLGATPDGLVEGSTITEFKAPYSLRNGGEFKPLSEQPHYYAQLQIEMLCAGVDNADFVQWSPVLPLYIESVCRDQEWLDENLSKLKAFHKRYLSELNNPEPKRVQLTAIEAQKLVDEYDELSDAIDLATARKKDILEDLILLAGERNAQIGDTKLTKVDRKGSVAYAQVVKKHLPDLDLKPFTGQSTSYWLLK